MMLCDGQVLVSVVMPSYNHERYLSQAIQSILDQTMPYLELIIVDDCSTDGSRAIIRRHADADLRIRPVFHERNHGIARTLNDGTGMACGRFVAPTASDDVWMPTKLERQLQALERDNDLVVWSDGTVIDAAGKVLHHSWLDYCIAQTVTRGGNLFDALLRGNFVSNSQIFKREILKECCFDESLKYLNDYRFMVDLAHDHEFFFIDEPLISYRVHGANTSCSDAQGWTSDSVNIDCYFLKHYGEEMTSVSRAVIYRRLARAYLSQRRFGKCAESYVRAYCEHPRGISLNKDFCKLVALGKRSRESRTHWRQANQLALVHSKSLSKSESKTKTTARM